MSHAVLIADANTERAERLAEACAAGGLQCSRAGTGSQALQEALAEAPAALIVQLDLPLIDGAQLVSILRANPRMQQLVVTYVSERAPDRDAADLEAPLVLAPVDATAVAQGLIERLKGSAGSARAGGGAAASEGRGGGVEGQLSQLALADLLLLFHSSQKTGVVEMIRSSGQDTAERGRVFLCGGEVVAAQLGTAEGKKALYRLLGWQSGSFAFKPEAVQRKPQLDLATRDLVRDGLRQLEEAERLAGELPALEDRLTLRIERGALPNVIHPLTQEVLLVLESYSTVRDVLDRCTYPDYPVLRTLHTLIGRGMLERGAATADAPGGSGAAQPERAPARREAFSPGQGARLREWLLGAGGGPDAADAKVAVVASSGAAALELVRLLERAEAIQFEASPEADAVADDDLVSLGRIAVDTHLGIELIHVPAAAGFAPFWHVAGYGALAVLALLTGPTSAAVARVADAVRGLAHAPRSRVLALQLVGKDAREAADESLGEQRGRLGIGDADACFEIETERADARSEPLRALLARLVP